MSNLDHGRWCTVSGCFCAAWLLLCGPVSACGADWWNAQWPCRARIVCEPGPGNVAWVRLSLAGRTTPDGRDLRLIDADGRPRSFEILHHDPRLTTLIQFRVPPERRVTTWLYYGNREAPSITATNPDFDTFQERWGRWKENQTRRNEVIKQRGPLEKEFDELTARLKDVEGVGQTGVTVESLRRRIEQIREELAALPVPDPMPEPKAPSSWYARRGLLLRVYRKAKPGHPETLRELRQLIGDSALEGAAFRNSISDGFNPFGTSEEYISVYEGYLRIDEPGEYALCTVSDDGSWVLVNGHLVVSWPGGHGFGGAEHGEKNGAVKLRKGVARVQYYHEEGTGGQMAFVGWKPPGAERFGGIPKGRFLDVRRARVAAYEGAAQSLLAVPWAEMVSTYWIRDTEAKQASMIRFVDRGQRGEEQTHWRWDFGDGLSADGREVQHVYFRLGRPEVTLTVTDGAGHRDAVSFSPNVFHTDHVARGRKYGKAKGYIEATRDYDADRMARDDLALYAEFCANLEQWPQHTAAARALIRRFPGTPVAAQVAGEAAKSCLQPQAYDPQTASELFLLALKGAESRPDRFGLMIRRARLLTWHLDRPEAAKKLLDEVREEIRGQKGRISNRLRRECLIGLGDAAVMTGDYERAEDLYRQAEGGAQKKGAQAEKLAKCGSYEYTVEDLLCRGEYAWAREVLDRWERQYPLQKLEGLTFFLRGKVLFIEHPGELALRYLDLAERVAPRGVHVPEAVWLRANCHLVLHHNEEALASLRRITVDFTYSEFLKRATEKIKEVEARAKGQTR